MMKPFKKTLRLLFILSLVFSTIFEKSVIKCDNTASLKISSPQDGIDIALHSSIESKRQPRRVNLQENDKNLMQNDAFLKYCTDARKDLIALVKGQLNLNT